MSNTKDYLIDIASESKYSGQNEEYREAFTKWRTRDNNRYGYKYVKDTREHTYAFGEGFENDLASDSERDSLKYCSCLIGGTLIISALIRLLQVMYDTRIGHLLAGSSIEVYGSTHTADLRTTVILSMFKPFSLLLCIIIIAAITRLPRKVFLPSGNNMPMRHKLCLLSVTAGFGVTCYVISILFKLIFGNQYMSLPNGFVWCNDVGLNIHCFGMQYLLTPVLNAVLLNGLILQLLRQFGDSTAVILTAAIESLVAINLTNIGTHFVMGLIVSIVCIKTGSILMAILSRILIDLVFFSLKFIDTTFPDGDDEIYLILFCIVVLGVALFSVGRLISADEYKINIRGADTQLEFRDKLKIFFTAMPTITWLAASTVLWIYIMGT